MIFVSKLDVFMHTNNITYDLFQIVFMATKSKDAHQLAVQLKAVTAAKHVTCQQQQNQQQQQLK